MEHLNTSEKLSAGLKAIPNKISSFASTQAAWRFYANEKVSLSMLQNPLIAAAHEGIATHCAEYALCIHDWSHLNYKHANKTDTYAITHKTDVGYDLQTSLIVSDQTGQRIAPVAQRLVCADGSYSTYGNDELSLPIKNHLDEVSDCIAFLDKQEFEKPLVHIIDREADSIFHIRCWEAGQSRWLVRVKDDPRLDYNGTQMKAKAIADELEFVKTREVIYHGKTYWQWVAQADVTLTRPAKPSQKKGKKPIIPGEPVFAKMVVSRVLSEDGEVLAQWLMMTNVQTVDAATIALWYYWRWQIESFFKLLKSAGHHMESWQQESALAIAKRLLVVSMACVMVWQIATDNSQEAQELKRFLIKLSGRQMRHKHEFSNPALLAGLWVFLSMFEIMNSYTTDELNSIKTTAQQIFGKLV